MQPSEYAKQPVVEVMKLPKWDRSQTARVIKALDDSGMSIAKFCRAQGLNYWRVMNAKRRLKAVAASGLEAIRAPALVPVAIEQTTEAIGTDDDGRYHWVLEVRLSGCVVRVAAGASQQSVAATLQAVGALLC
jgi:hypothetical protein